ncbi:MAG: NAD(P)H-dependent oxidoreductase [Candidatus Dependentiae bacterium]|nr:NAD(P)H-dependent oxidoreductase [Candidatus Dependentiae bacterium]
MNHVKFMRIMTVFGVLIFMIGLGSKSLCSKAESKKGAAMKISIIVGSVRSTTTGIQIAQNIQNLLKDRSDIVTDVICVAHYHLPFYTDEASPASRKEEIIEPVLKKWADVVTQAEGFIIVSPEYNGGYPAPLKNALDSLYQEWNNKSVGIVGYSGGPSGGTCMISQLQQVVQRLEMIPVATSIKIPCSWKAFNEYGDLVNASAIEKELNIMVDELIKARKN